MAMTMTAGPPGLPAPTLQHVLVSWQWAPAADALLLLLAAGYLLVSRRVGRRHPARPWPVIRTAAFLAGLAMVAVALDSAASVYDDELFSAHMVQHVLLIMVAPPLLIFGRPVTLLLHGFGNPFHARLVRLLRSRTVAATTWPSAVTALYVTVVAGTHTPLIMNLVVRDRQAHLAEHLLYLVAGYLFFLPIVGSEPVRWRPSFAGRYLMLLIGMQADTLVGLALTMQGGQVFSAYQGIGRLWPPSTTGDVRGGGVIMWAGSDLVMAALAIALAVAFVHGRRRAGGLRGGIEHGRRAALERSLAAAHLEIPAAGSAATIDDDAHLAAYNAFLADLGAKRVASPAAGSAIARSAPATGGGSSDDQVRLLPFLRGIQSG